jgi:hypothetical protein
LQFVLGEKAMVMTDDDVRRFRYAGTRASGTNPRALGINSRAKARNKWALRGWKRKARKGGGAKDLLSRSDAALLKLLVEEADAHYCGHLTIVKFTTNWRIGFADPPAEGFVQDEAGEYRSVYADWPVGKTFGEAARAALKRRYGARQSDRSEEGP